VYDFSAETVMVISQIHKCYEELSEELKRAAKWIVDHPQEACFLSMREQARRAEVVAPTMIRLAKALGFASFPVLQETLRSHISWGNANYSDHAKNMQGEESSDAHVQLGALHITNLNSIESLNHSSHFERIAVLILNAKRTVFFGVRSSYSVAFHAYYLHQMLLDNGKILDDRYGMLPDECSEFDEETVMILFGLSPYPVRVIEIAQQAKKTGVKLVAVTDSKLSPLARLSQEVLLFHAASNSFMHSMVGAYALIERLMAQVARSGGDAIISHLQKRETALKQSGVYWQEKSTRAKKNS
jgi:DNA-binding MurR/RpiR family transcriptional regulator